MGDFLDTKNLMIMQKSLDAMWTKQKIISSNIANIDTPGFKTRSVNFENALKNAIESGASENSQKFKTRLDNLEPEIKENKDTSLREDGNNVDIDDQNIELTRTMIQYEFMSRSISSDISRLKYAINEGRG